ncbi:MAG: NAD-dependent epimerase/dehydratase family protein [Gemmatimonadota bacterium]|nr:NAD-dependent epimerase/dehydratase family protein [Gemmatimonadota bacterium]
MNCLVTGGAGFIGSHIADRLVEVGHAVRVVDNLSTGRRANLTQLAGRIEFLLGDLCDPAVCREAANGIDVVFHVAALPSVPRSLEDPWGSHDANVNSTVRLLEGCRAGGVRRVVYSSSSSVYGDTPELPKREGMELMPRSPYAAAKLASEQYVLAYARAGLLEGVALRYFNVFGPRQSPGSQYAAVIPIFLNGALHGTPVSVFGDGEQTRDFTFVENVVEANMLAAWGEASRVSGHAVNIGNGERTSLRDVLAMIEEVTGRKVAREYLPPRGGDVRDSLASLERVMKVLGYAPRVGLREGLRRAWAWIVSEAGAPETADVAG